LLIAAAVNRLLLLLLLDDAAALWMRMKNSGMWIHKFRSAGRRQSRSGLGYTQNKTFAQ